MLTRAGVRLFSSETLKVANDVAKQQFTVILPDANAVVNYDQRGKNITFKHTEVPSVYQGQGIGRKLAEYAFDHAYKNNLDVTCQCHFLAKYLEENKTNYRGLRIAFELENDE